MPPPVPPTDLRDLSEEELRRMEGVEQHHLAARVQWLRDIHATLDAAMMQIHQYNQLCNSMGWVILISRQPVHQYTCTQCLVNC